MRLKSLTDADIPLVADWMSSKENHQWLDFGQGNQILTAPSLKVMMQRNLHLLRTFTSDTDDAPIGLVGLSNISRDFKTATIWYVLGDKRHGRRGYTTRAVSEVLGLGFRDLRLEAVNAWVVEPNAPSIRVLVRNHFQLIGRQRKCHYIDGQAFDRLLFDLLAADHGRTPLVEQSPQLDGVASFFVEQMKMETPSPETDLVEAGVLDSLGFAELFLYLEEAFGIQISLDELEIENFRSIARINDFIRRHREGG